MSSKKILICDNHLLFGFGIQAILEKYGFSVLVVQSSKECIKEIQSRNFDILLLDLNLDEKNGFDIFIETRELLKNKKTFILTSYDDPFLVEKSQNLGFNGYLRKEISTDELIEALEMNMNAPFYNSLSNASKEKTQGIEALKDSFSTNSVRLSRQEKEIIKFVVSGETSKSTAEKLFISKSTVDTHRRNIYRKLEINGISSLIRFANENMLIS